MTRAPALDRLTLLAYELRATDEEAATLLMALIAREQAPMPRAGRVKTQRVRHARTGEWLEVDEKLIKEALK